MEECRTKKMDRKPIGAHFQSAGQSSFPEAHDLGWTDATRQWRFDGCTDRPVAERLLTLQASRQAGLLPEVASLTARNRPSAWSPPHARAPGLRARAILEPGRQCPLAPWPG
jgi:hypothetical protein